MKAGACRMCGVRTSLHKETQAIALYRQGLSERKISSELGVDPATVHRILVRQNMPRRSISEACMKYPKRDFGGDPAEEARLCGFSNDFWVGHRWKQVSLQTSTTHPSQIRLSNDYFGKYGHISRTPEFNKHNSAYQWKVQILLNRSFNFIVEYRKNPLKFLARISKDNNAYEHMTGIAEAESWVGVYSDRGHPRVCLSVGNKNLALLEWARSTLGGGISPGDKVYQLKLRDEECIKTLRVLSIRHAEKAAAKELILRHSDKGVIGLEALREYRELRERIDEEVQSCITQARLEWIRKHGKPHTKDPDQTFASELTYLPSSLFHS